MGQMKKVRRKVLPKESQTVEWKQSLGEWKEIVETCAAFATSKGGTIYVGISPDGTCDGTKIGKRSLEDLANKIKTNTDPPQFPTMETTGPDDAAMLEIRIEDSPIKPVWAFGRPLKRVGRTNQRLKRDEAQRLVEISTRRTWDAYQCPEFTSKHILKRAVRDFLERAGMKLSTPVGDVLTNIGMPAEASGYCNGAALLFGRRPQQFFVEAQVKCGRFIGTDSVEFLDEITLDGPILHQLEEALAFVTRNTRQAIRITGKPSHDRIPEYPERAVREAIINALCHRDYTDAGTIQVRIYDDRLEVWSPGGLPYGVTLRQLYRRHRSHPRNRLIAQALHRARLIEHWGTGTLRIIEACKERDIDVEYTVECGCFIACLRQRGKVSQIPPEPGLELGLESGLESDVAVQILSALSGGPRSRSQIAAALGHKRISGAVNRCVKDLLARRLVEYTIPEKPNSRLQKYRLTDKGRVRMKKP